MVSATFGDDMWTCQGVGLTRVLSCIKVRNTKPVALVLEAATPEEERKRRAIAYAEPSEEQKVADKKVIHISIMLFAILNCVLCQQKAEELMKSMLDEDKSLLKKRKGLFGLW
jgi:hypothetical protein